MRSPRHSAGSTRGCARERSCWCECQGEGNYSCHPGSCSLNLSGEGEQRGAVSASAAVALLSGIGKDGAKSALRELVAGCRGAASLCWESRSGEALPGPAQGTHRVQRTRARVGQVFCWPHHYRSEGLQGLCKRAVPHMRLHLWVQAPIACLRLLASP